MIMHNRAIQVKGLHTSCKKIQVLKRRGNWPRIHRLSAVQAILQQ